ncbi:hypothetical protein EDB19DRAFT_687329 [Suillus lakei]|nr:hypothetical protein EDB19DRAFT_687329 [Suillus lakei]
MTDYSVSWNETITIHGRPLMFPRWLLPIFSRKSKSVHLEIRASFESGPMLGRDELVGTFETTLEQLLANDGQSELSLPVINNQRPSPMSKQAPRMNNPGPSLILKAHHKKTPRLISHAAGSIEQVHELRQSSSSSPLTSYTLASNDETYSRERNIVIFGESGSGKSSVINAIMKKSLAKTSSSATGCTFTYERHPVEISGQRFALYDTAGLNEGTAGTVPAAKAEEKLKSLLHELMGPGSDGISLLVYCVRSTRARHALTRNYNMFFSAICRKKVPIVLVVTGLENEPVMENWWKINGQEFDKRGMHFEDHACVTTLHKHPGIPDVFDNRIAESSDILRDLIVNNCSEWAVDDSWFKRSFADVRHMFSDRWNSERSSPSTLIICDSSPKEELEILPCVRGTMQSCLASIGRKIYQVYRVPQPEPNSRVEGRLEGDLLIYYARASEHSTARPEFPRILYSIPREHGAGRGGGQRTA